MKAKEAKEIADKSNKIIVEEQLKIIMEFVHNVAEDGCYEVKISTDKVIQPLPGVKARLIEDGYDVEEDNWYVYVRWGGKKTQTELEGGQAK